MDDTIDDTTTSRRRYLQAAGAVGLAGVSGLAGCIGSGDAATGTLATAVTDQPGDISDFERCVVTIDGFWLKAGEEGTDGATTDSPSTDGVRTQAADDVDQSDDREYHAYDEPQTADLVQLQDGETELVDEREVDVGTYAFLQLDVSGVDATLTDGGSADVDTPGDAPLQFKHAFEVREDQRTTFTADVTPVKRGQTGSYVLQPVATRTGVTYETVTTTSA